MTSKRRKELATIVAPKAIFQENVIRKNKIGRTNSKVLHRYLQQEKLNFL
jgi:hypothetical protein